MLKWLKTVMLAVMLSSVLLIAPVIAAQEAEATAEVVEAESAVIESEGEISSAAAGNVPGVSAAMLFLGAGAIVVVGLLMIARDNFRGETE